ncbi:MAG TPA: alcohol dehydrogenase catalytic domain-containing protein [Thermoanaerobaculia bacterium]|jgi:threonine 3-dehydrogenase|nr:alcohol dehydrogenase catalytic domain-containing protein [Thermoanaerobaculia bacterium]
MQAVVKSQPLDGEAGTEIRDCPVPKPAADEILIRVAAAAICGTDKHIYHWDPSIRDKVKPPRIYGHEFCGFIEAFGERAHRENFSVGDYVSAEMHVICGECPQCRSGNGHICIRTKIYGLDEDGAFAEFVTVPATNVIKLGPYVPLRVGAFLDALGNAVHTTQVCDLAGKSVAITGFGPIGAMAAVIAEHSGASTVIVTDVNDQALETARRWAAGRNFANLHAFNVRSTDPREVKKAIEAITDGVGVDFVAEMSGSSAAINFALDIVRMGGFLSLLGLPSGHSVTIEDYTRNIIFKGITMQGIIGRRMYGTWQRMLSLLRSGLDVEWIVQATFDSLQEFHEGMRRFDRHEALKVVFFPEGEKNAQARLP